VTFLDALSEAEKTGCLVYRKKDTGDGADNVIKAWHVLALNYDGKTIRRYSWTMGNRESYHVRGRPAGWADYGHGALFLTVEDFRADDWATHPLEPWFVSTAVNIWNPLKVASAA